jgi:hypothetical protein
MCSSEIQLLAANAREARRLREFSRIGCVSLYIDYCSIADFIRELKINFA